MLVGAGTVLTSEQADAAVAAGAKFIVSPGFNPENVRYCLSKGVTVVPGCATCGEMEQAMALGLDTVKFFPAEANGGAEGYLRTHNSAFHKRFAKRNCLFCILDFDNWYYSAKFYLL